MNRLFRQAQTDTWVDTVRVLMVGVFVLVAAAVATVSFDAIARFRESRAYRDAQGLTPFKDVVVTHTVVAGNKLLIWGVLTKVRCENKGETVYALGQDGVWYVAEFDPSPEADSTPLDRPPLAGQEFGPWGIISPIPDPKAAVLFKVHECPEGISKNTLFFVPWADSDEPQEQ